MAQIDECFEMVAFAASDHHVCPLVEGIAGDGHDVEMLGVLMEPFFFDEAAVCDDGDGFHVQVLFAVSVVSQVVIVD